MSLTARNRLAICIFASCCCLLFLQIASAGTILKASCPCGYRVNNIYAGGGFANFKNVCAAPACCAACKTMEILNYLEDAPKCKTCGEKPVFYNDPSLQEKPRTGSKPRNVFSWNTEKKGAFELPDINYRCPRCGKLTLRFTMTGMWD